MDPILLKFRDKFIEEAHGLLDNLEKNLLEIEAKTDNNDIIEPSFRAMHTLKGISSMYGFNFISEFTHHLESIWQCIRDKKMKLSKEIFDVTFSSVDHIRRLLEDEKLANQDNIITHKKLLDKVIQISTATHLLEPLPIEPTVHQNTTSSTWHILMRITEMLFFRGIRINNILSELLALGDYEISKVDSLCDSETDVWSFLLTTNASEAEIRDVFLFIEDDCTLVNLTAGNMLSDGYEGELLAKQNKGEKTLLDYANNTDALKPQVVIAESSQKVNDAVVQTKKTVRRISVDSSKLDQLMFLVSELITVNSQLNMSLRSGILEQMIPHLERVDLLSKQFRNNAIEIRLVPLGDTVLRFQRLIRDLSIQLGKKVEFKTSGVDTELDKNTIDQLAEPLMHIIRNSIDHGLEIPEKRKKSGKSDQGILTLNASYSGNYVLIDISDDGNGVDIDKVKQKAIDLGILKPTDTPTQKEILDLIFLPGFSTAQSLTSVSGRGVGMDIVKQRITELRGEVWVNTKPGEGTTFSIKIQQSIAIIDTLLFRVDKTYFTVPISEIQVCLQHKLVDLNARRNTSTIEFNNHLIPFVDLRHLFDMELNSPDMTKIIVVRNGSKELALIADEIIGEHQAVLKPLGSAFHDQKYLASASQIGDGNMAFMIDTNALLKERSY